MHASARYTLRLLGWSNVPFTMTLFAWSLLVGTGVRGAEQGIDFETKIAPIFEAHCLACHSPNNSKGDLSLSTASDLEEFGYVVPGNPDASYLLELISPADERLPQMPKDGEPLTEQQVDGVRRWIEQGADWPDDVELQERSQADASWWAFQPLDFELPTSRLASTSTSAKSEGTGALPPSDEQSRHGLDEAMAAQSPAAASAMIDAFIDARLRDQGLRRNPPADRRTLIRRATYDLTGLPPSPEQVKAFVHDSDPDAYEKLIDRLLASPRYGERWGRHWLDVVRFGESNGFERNVLNNQIWPFRDYVIRSINADKPFDRFFQEHIAGDVLAEDNPDVAVGSAFLVAGPYDDVGNQDPEQAAQIRANTLDEIIRATGEAFLGLTIGCARCHYHKFDPISQQDYYALYATFSGIQHGAVPLATSEAKAENERKLAPLNRRASELQEKLQQLDAKVIELGREKLDNYQAKWTRPAIDRTGTEETFEPVEARYVRLVCEAQDVNLDASSGFGIDEFEIWSSGADARNVALAEHGAVASGASRQIEDFPGAYGPQLTIDGELGENFIAASDRLEIDLGQPRKIERILFSSARGESSPEQHKFRFVAEYRIEVSSDGESWSEIASSHDRQPRNDAHRDHRLLRMEVTPAEQEQRRKLGTELADVRKEIAAVPPIPSVWIGTRDPQAAEGPFHIFQGGSPQKPGKQVVLTSLSALDGRATSYHLPTDAPESQRRLELAEWMTADDNPLPPRVLANRLWHYHFGTGIVATPSDFGFMGDPPSHPELLDFLAHMLHRYNWRLKPMHRAIMLSQTYRQASTHRAEAASVDGESRLLWRYPPRRLSAEEIRDTLLSLADRLDTRMGGPGFRLYHFMQDNVCTYEPLDEHGPETYRRAVYHQNARASVVDLMTDFDQPDCAFSTPRRSQTTTPLQALTMLNHSFSLDMAEFLAERIRREAGDATAEQVTHAFRLCFSRKPRPEEFEECLQLVHEHGLSALCRALLNTSELIYVQ